MKKCLGQKFVAQLSSLLVNVYYEIKGLYGEEETGMEWRGINASTLEGESKGDGGDSYNMRKGKSRDGNVEVMGGVRSKEQAKRKYDGVKWKKKSLRVTWEFRVLGFSGLRTPRHLVGPPQHHLYRRIPSIGTEIWEIVYSGSSGKCRGLYVALASGGNDGFAHLGWLVVL
ncbi:hypothetical protein Ancab_021694 [Ancistrocladus abbreviatus]